MSTPTQLVSSVFKLFSLPDVFIRCKALLDDPNASISEMGKVISTDPGLTTRLLRIANSAFFGFASKIDTVPRAITLMGTRQLHSLILATSVARAFDKIPEKLVDMSAFWWHSVYGGVAARLLAAECNVLDTDRLFVAGLLRDIGHLIMYQKIPDQTRNALQRSRETGEALFLVERELLGFDYAEVGAELMRAWNLPVSLQDAIGHHTEPGKAGEFALEAAIVHLGETITTMAKSMEENRATPPHIDPEAWRITGLSADVLNPIQQRTDLNAFEAVELIVPARKQA